MKLSHDPNNKKWASDKDSFGLKIMASQGWRPGDYLGVRDAPHAEFHTAANASHIRVMIKDDNLGLGAKIGSGVGHGECTGLDAFKNLLGRLNGEDEEELEKEQKSREDLKRAIYTERRWGSIRFVQGGFLVGDKIQQLIDEEAERIGRLAAGSVESRSGSSDSSEPDEELEPVVEKPKKSKKRKLEAQDGPQDGEDVKVKKSKKRKSVEQEQTPEVFAVKVKKSKKRKSEATLEDVAKATAIYGDANVSKKKSKRSRTVKDGDEEEEGKDMEPKQRKEDKREKRRKEKTDGMKSRLDEEHSSKNSSKKSKRDKKREDPGALSVSAESTQPAMKEETPSTPLSDSGRSTPIMVQGRHAVRARNIAQKRLASMDVASLNQVSVSLQTRG